VFAPRHRSPLHCGHLRRVEDAWTKIGHAAPGSPYESSALLQAAGWQPADGLGLSGPAAELAAGARAGVAAPRGRRTTARGSPLLRLRTGDGVPVSRDAPHPRSPGACCRPSTRSERAGRSADGTTGRIIRPGDQRVALRARGPCEQSVPALGLPAHGGRRLRDEKGEQRGLPATDDSPPATRSRHEHTGHVDRVLRPPVGLAAVFVPGREPRGLSHAGREWRREGGSRERHLADAVAPELAVVRSDRRGKRRAALVSDLHGA